jgi:hypothetical protein
VLRVLGAFFLPSTISGSRCEGAEVFNYGRPVGLAEGEWKNREDTQAQDGKNANQIGEHK